MTCFPLSWSVYSEPATEPVTVADLKLHLRIDGSDEDTLLSSLITAARKHVEEYCERSLITQTLIGTADNWPIEDDWQIRLPRPAALSVTSITYVDSSGTQQTLSTSLYTLDTRTGTIRPTYNAIWPDARTQPQSITITWVAGYGAATAVPEPIKQAIKMLAGDWYRNRETNIVGTIVASLPMGVESLLSPYRVF